MFENFLVFCGKVNETVDPFPHGQFILIVQPSHPDLPHVIDRFGAQRATRTGKNVVLQEKILIAILDQSFYYAPATFDCYQKI